MSGHKRSKDGSGEVRLIATVLWQAVEDAVSPRPKYTKPDEYDLENPEISERKMALSENRMLTKQEKNDAIRWIESDDNVPFTFIWCCEVLSLDHHQIRYQVLRYPAQTWRNMKDNNASLKEREHVRSGNGGFNQSKVTK